MGPCDSRSASPCCWRSPERSRSREDQRDDGWHDNWRQGNWRGRGHGGWKGHRGSWWQSKGGWRDWSDTGWQSKWGKDKEASTPKEVRTGPRGEKPDGCTTLWVGWMEKQPEMKDIVEFFKAEPSEVEASEVRISDHCVRGYFAHVTFASTEDLDKAVKRAGNEIQGKPLSIDWARMDKATGASTSKEERSNLHRYKPKSLKPENGHTLWVGDLALETKEQDLVDLFEPCGKVEMICIQVNQLRNGQFGFLKFFETEAVDKAAELAGTPVKGVPIRLDFAEDKPIVAYRVGKARGVHAVPAAKPDGCCTVWIGSLPDDVTDESLKAMFEKCGEIKAIRLRKGQAPGQPHYCHIEFTATESVDEAIKLSGETMGDSKIRVDFAVPKRGPRQQPAEGAPGPPVPPAPVVAWRPGMAPPPPGYGHPPGWPPPPGHRGPEGQPIPQERGAEGVDMPPGEFGGPPPGMAAPPPGHYVPPREWLGPMPGHYPHPPPDGYIHHHHHRPPLDYYGRPLDPYRDHYGRPLGPPVHGAPPGDFMHRMPPPGPVGYFGSPPPPQAVYDRYQAPPDAATGPPPPPNAIEAGAMQADGPAGAEPTGPPGAYVAASGGGAVGGNVVPRSASCDSFYSYSSYSCSRSVSPDPAGAPAVQPLPEELAQ